MNIRAVLISGCDEYREVYRAWKESLSSLPSIRNVDEIEAWRMSEREVFRLLRNHIFSCKDRDLVVLYVSAHGARSGAWYFHPDRKASHRHLVDILLDSSCRVLVLNDSCYAGMLIDACRDAGVDGGRVGIIAASQRDRISMSPAFSRIVGLAWSQYRVPTHADGFTHIVPGTWRDKLAPPTLAREKRLLFRVLHLFFPERKVTSRIERWGAVHDTLLWEK